MTSGHFVQKCRAAGMFPPPSFRLSGGGELTATTRLITHHISKGETVAQSLKDRFDYGQNPEKTQGGELISAYECDHRTADAEFLLAKAKYKAVTGREQRRDADVLCYQIRQSFRPGEITPEEANRVGYETAMRWTKGKHAFFVATHTDRQHIHNHIYYNSTTLDYTGKFRDFFRSAAALRRLSDRVCLEHDLSVIHQNQLAILLKKGVDDTLYQNPLIRIPVAHFARRNTDDELFFPVQFPGCCRSLHAFSQ